MLPHDAEAIRHALDRYEAATQAHNVALTLLLKSSDDVAQAYQRAKSAEDLARSARETAAAMLAFAARSALVAHDREASDVGNAVLSWDPSRL